MPDTDGRRDDTFSPSDDGDDPPVVLDAFERVQFTDEELTELALDATPFDPFDPDVEPLDDRGRTGYR